MRLLINIDEAEKGSVGMLAAILKQHGHTGAVSTQVYKAHELVAKANTASCEAILCINEATLKKMTGRPKATLDSYRGSRFNFGKSIFIANPLAHVMTVDEGRWLLDRDIEKISLCKREPAPFNWVKCDTTEKQAELVVDASRAVLIAFDVETNPAYRLITCISFAMLMPDGKILVRVIPFTDFSENHYHNEYLMSHALSTMRTILSNPVPKAAHNGIYDCSYCISYGAAPSNYIYDTMIMSWSRYSELPRSLDFVASLYLYDYIQWKHESGDASANKDIMSYWAYCAKDSWTTLRIAIQQLGLSTKESYWIRNYNRTFRLTYPSIYCAFEGCKIDISKRDELLTAARQDLHKIEQDFKVMTATPQYNPASPQQVSKFLYDIIGAKRPATAKSATATDEKTLNRVAMQHPLLAKIVDIQLTYKEKQKLVSTYYTFQLFGDRALWAIDPSGTETGRMASKQSPFGVWDAEEGPLNLGLQIMNIPTEGAKEMFLPDEDFVLVEIDKSKSEARCVAYLSESWNMADALEDTSRDYYMVLSSEFFGIPYEKVTKYMRNKVTKKIIHGSNYLMGAETFISSATPKELFKAMQELGMKLDLKAFASYLLSLYHKPFPKLKEEWYPSIIKEIRLSKHLTSPLGWVRRFFGNASGSNAHKLLRTAVAHVPQNLSVQLLNEDFWQDYQMCLASGGKIRLKAQIHDSRLMQIHKSILFQTLPTLVDRQQPVVVNGRTMLIPSECKLSDKNWQDMKEWEHGAT